MVALNLWVGSGSADDPPDRAGVAHFLEHMLFRGGASREGSLATEVHSAGGYLNAETGCDHTMYYQVIPAERWKSVLAVLGSSLEAPTYDPDAVESERAVIMEEASGAESDPSVFVWRRLMETAFSVHPCRRPVTGSAESISRITRADLAGHYGTHYVGGNLALVIVGDVHGDEAIECVEATVGGLPGGAAPVRRRVSEPIQDHTRTRFYAGEVAQPYVALGFHVPHALHADIPALDALSGLLGVGRSSRLRKALQVSRSLVSDIGSMVVAYRDVGLLVVRAVAAEPDVARVLEGILEEIARLRSEPPSPEEMEKNLRRLEAGYVLERETADTLAGSLGLFETLGDVGYAERYVDLLAAVGTDDIVRVAGRYLVPGNMSVVCYLPADGAECDDRSREFAAMAERALSGGLAGPAHAGRRWSAPAGFSRPMIRETPADFQARRRALASGGRLVVCESRALPVVSVALGFRGGFADEPPELAGITYLAQKLAMRGTATRSSDELADAIESLGTTVTTAVDRDGFGLGTTVVSKHLRDVAEILGDVVSNPGVPDDQLESVKSDVVSEIRKIEDHPVRLAIQKLLPLVFPDHPYGRPLRGREDTVLEITADQLTEWRRRHWTGADLVACLVGDASLDEAHAVLDRALAGLPDGRSAGGPGAVTLPPSGEVVLTRRELDQSVVALGFPGPCAGTDEAAFCRLVARGMSMMGGMLWQALRERPPHAYLVGASVVAYRLGGAFVFYAGVPPGSEDAAIGAVVGVLDALRKHGMGPAELELAKRHLAGAQEISMMRGSVRAAAYAMAELADVGYERVDAVPEIVRGATNDNVVHVAERFLDPDTGYARVVVRGSGRRP